MSANQLNQRLRWLVLERQSLLERGAAADDLERNREELVRAQRRLSYAFIHLHRPDGPLEAA
jgi:hypothetical protein